jgi:predicted kinase
LLEHRNRRTIQVMQQVLFLLVGYPGSGKTTASRLIHEQTGAVHIWADRERRLMFGNPTHSKDESRALYDHLNNVTDQLLGQGKSVIFDTNFNFYKDRQHLRDIAKKHGAKAVVIWITTPKETAKKRAVHERTLRNFYEYVLPEEVFERMSNHLEPPREDEHPVTLDGTHIDAETISQTLAKVV